MYRSTGVIACLTNSLWSTDWQTAEEVRNRGTSWLTHWLTHWAPDGLHDRTTDRPKDLKILNIYFLLNVNVFTYRSHKMYWTPSTDIAKQKILHEKLRNKLTNDGTRCLCYCIRLRNQIIEFSCKENIVLLFSHHPHFRQIYRGTDSNGKKYEQT